MASKATITCGLRLGRSKVLRSLRHYLRAQSQEHHTIELLAETGVERGSTRRDFFFFKDEKGPSLVRRTLELFHKATLEKILRDGVERIIVVIFQAHSYHLEQN